MYVLPKARRGPRSVTKYTQISYAGDFIGYPAGGPPHQLVNTSKGGMLRCLVAECAS